MKYNPIQSGEIIRLQASPRGPVRSEGLVEESEIALQLSRILFLRT